jgi:hypothetical protein
LKTHAHRAKGAANSAHCHRLASVSLRIEMTGKEGLTLPLLPSSQDNIRAKDLWDQVIIRSYHRLHEGMSLLLFVH